MIKKLLRIFTLYLLSCLGISAIFLVVYKLIGTEQSIVQVFLYSVIQTFNCGTGISNALFATPNIATVAHQFLGQVLFVILTGYTVSAIYNYNKKDIVLADKMIIRKRTSPGVENEITISVMAENKSKYRLYNAHCEMNCFYYKSENANETNKDTYCFKVSPDIKNFYRYSFGLEELPIKFWETLIKKDGLNYNELSIEVRLSGKLDNFDNEISIRKTYKMSDIVIAKGSENIIERISVDGKAVKKSKPKWDNINKIIEYNEIERQEIVSGILEHINKNSNKISI